MGARAGQSRATRPPADPAALCSIQYPNFSLLRGLSGVCLNYSDMNSHSENVHSFERSSTSDFCLWCAGLILSTLPSLMRFLFQRVALCPGFDRVKCAGDSFCYHVYPFICLSFESSPAHNEDAAGRPLGAALPAKSAFSGRRDGDVLAGSCSARNFDFCVAKHPNGERAFEETPSNHGGLGRYQGVISSHENLGGNKAKLGLAWQSCVS